jgi:hypothetical protein
MVEISAATDRLSGTRSTLRENRRHFAGPGDLAGRAAAAMLRVIQHQIEQFEAAVERRLCHFRTFRR